MTLTAPYAQMARSTNRSTAKRRPSHVLLLCVTSPGAPGLPHARAVAAALRQAVAAVAPSRLPEFFQEIQDAFTQAGDEDSVFPIRHFYQRWGAAVAIERRPSVAARLHAAERALADPDPAIRDQAVREAAEIVQAAYREVAGG
jgi:hypothetical protein